MRKLLILSLIFVFGMGLRLVWASDDNLLAVDVSRQEKKIPPRENKVFSTQETPKNSASVVSGQRDEFAKDLEKIKAFHEAMNDKRHAVEMIRLDLEKESLLLKEKQAQKQIYDIDNSLPLVKKEEFQKSDLSGGLKVSGVDPSDVRLLMIVIAGGLKEGILTLKGTPYRFKEGDCVASKLTVSKITRDTLTLKQPDQTEFTLNFMD
ncbi:hypothetical protein BU251_02540 [Candidatus Velamenicoccus archaeovorus]|uniref:Type IV pilus biogenesis protein PilP n=1 Tax=Velamenicoccus archaeovorus TaxID=1930593 RepID=A0A410P3B2_VELA1|nr:hypothetical protein [Candidatus Velamenicoccus archaeovorus]QAT16687.1 hypothetical protein BU251_02540 [Candidatus Velamenicoccus archaeovorus]